MRKPNGNTKKKRLTLNKQIASAPSHADKWQIALHGGPPPTAIQRLPSQVYGLHLPSAHGPEWQAQAIEQAKQRFCDLLFPALMKDDPRPFEELLEAMAHRRRTTVSLEEFVRIQKLSRQRKLTKKETGRRLRLELLGIHPDDLVSMDAVLAYLSSNGVEFSDESHVRRVMRELEIRLLRCGDTVFFQHSAYDANGGPKKWVCVRKIVIGKNGSVTNYGLSRKDYSSLLGMKGHVVQPAPDK